MAKQDDDIIWKFLTGLGGFILVMLVLTLFRGFVLSQMWAWFVVPFGAPALTVVHAIGVSMLAAFLTYQHDAAKKSEQSEKASFGVKLIEWLFSGTLFTAFVWGMGAVVHSFM